MNIIKLLLILMPLTGFCLEGQGEITLETKAYESDELDHTKDQELGVYTNLNYRHDIGSFSFSMRGYARAGLINSYRNIIYPEDLYVSLLGEEIWIIKAGYRLFNWSKTEAFHPADIINSYNLDRSFDDTEKLGEPTIELELDTYLGLFNFYYFPMVVDPFYPDKHSRVGKRTFKDPKWFDDGTPLKNDFSNQGGVKWQKSFDSFEVSAHIIRHMDRRQPILVPDQTTVGFIKVPNTDVMTPHHYKLTQYGGTFEFLFPEGFGGKILKGEFAYRDFDLYDQVTTAFGLRRPVDNWQLALSFENPLYWIKNHDTTFILEYQRIDGSEVLNSRRHELGLFQSDVLLGLRHAFNDIDGKEFLATFIFDTERSREFIYALTYSQRLTNFIKIKGGARFIDANQKEGFQKGLEIYDGDSHLFFNLSYFF